MALTCRKIIALSALRFNSMGCESSSVNIKWTWTLIVNSWPLHVHHGHYFLHRSILWRRPEGKATTPKIPNIPDIPFPRCWNQISAGSCWGSESWELGALFSGFYGWSMAFPLSEVPSSIWYTIDQWENVMWKSLLSISTYCSSTWQHLLHRLVWTKRQIPAQPALGSPNWVASPWRQYPASATAWVAPFAKGCDSGNLFAANVTLAYPGNAVLACPMRPMRPMPQAWHQWTGGRPRSLWPRPQWCSRKY